jgi:ABC-type xylose transport system permease subunit
MSLIGGGSDAQSIVKGIVLAGVVIFDVATRNRAK